MNAITVPRKMRAFSTAHKCVVVNGKEVPYAMQKTSPEGEGTVHARVHVGRKTLYEWRATSGEPMDSEAFNAACAEAKAALLGGDA